MTDTAPRINDSGFEVPDQTIAFVKGHAENSFSPAEVVQSLKGQKSRDWLNAHSYYCLPLLIGSQYGFVVRSLFDFTVIWNGGPAPEDCYVQVEDNEHTGQQFIASHFGEGIVTVQNTFHMRTPPGVNLITIAPPNFVLPGVTWLTAVVETDNLERDFTFNFKVHTPHYQVRVRKGDPIGCFLPTQRYWVDGFEFRDAADLFPPEVVHGDREATAIFTDQRAGPDREKPHQAGRQYYNGIKANGCPFKDHQRKVSK